MDERILSSLLGLGLMKIPSPSPFHGITPTEDRRAPDDASRMMAPGEIPPGWPDNWEETDSPLVLRRRNPDGSWSYQNALPEDLFGGDASDLIADQDDEFVTSKLHRYPLRW